MTSNNITRSIAEEVKVAMIRSRVSQQELADHLGMSQAAISRRLTGEVDFSAGDLSKTADLLGVEIGTLFAGATQ